MRLILRYLAPLAFTIERLLYYSKRILTYSRVEWYFRGKRTLMDYTTVLKHPDRIQMGMDVWLGSNVTLGAYAGLVLADRVRISHGALIETGSLIWHLPYHTLIQANRRASAEGCG